MYFLVKKHCALLCCVVLSVRLEKKPGRKKVIKSVSPPSPNVGVTTLIMRALSRIRNMPFTSAKRENGYFLLQQAKITSTHCYLFWFTLSKVAAFKNAPKNFRANSTDTNAANLIYTRMQQERKNACKRRLRQACSKRDVWMPGACVDASDDSYREQSR